MRFRYIFLQKYSRFWPAVLMLTLGGFALAQKASTPGDTQAEEKPLRLVVLAPGAAEMVHSLKRTDWIVGVGDFVSWPPQVRDLPKLGAYNQPNLETLVALETTTVITSFSVRASEHLAKLESLGIQVLDIPMDTLEQIYTGYRTLGRLLDRSSLAEAHIAAMRTKIGAIRAKAENFAPRKVLFVVDRNPLYVVGPGSHLDQLMNMVGGKNVADDIGAPFQMVSMEVMVARMPEVIIDTSSHGPDATRGQVPGSWSAWPFLPAVKNNRVYHVDPQRLVIPGPRFPQMAQLFAQLIHPEHFGFAEPSDFLALDADRQPSGPSEE